MSRFVFFSHLKWISLHLSECDLAAPPRRAGSRQSSSQSSLSPTLSTISSSEWDLADPPLTADSRRSPATSVFLALASTSRTSSRRPPASSSLPSPTPSPTPSPKEYLGLGPRLLENFWEVYMKMKIEVEQSDCLRTFERSRWKYMKIESYPCNCWSTLKMSRRK